MSIVALGTFDGVHGGHRELLFALKRIARERGEEAVIHTFVNHPRMVFAKAPKLLMTDVQRLALLKESGCRVIADTFTKEYAALTPEEFICRLEKELSLSAVVTGFNYTFGDHGRGDTKLLEELGKRHAFDAITVPPQMYKGEPISSTRIRQAVEDGDMETAQAMLKRPFSLEGEVVRNREIGRTIGYPTANISWNDELVLPKTGVYASFAVLEGQSFPAITNVGSNPTVSGDHTTIETYILNKSFDLYGKQMTVCFVARMREEKCFENIEALRRQIDRDKAEAEGILRQN